MVKAYIMTSVYPGTYIKALDEIKKIHNVEKISIVTGDYDIIVKVQVKNLEDLHKLTHQLHLIGGIEKTITSVVTKELNLMDADKNISTSAASSRDVKAHLGKKANRTDSIDKTVIQMFTPTEEKLKVLEKPVRKNSSIPA